MPSKTQLSAPPGFSRQTVAPQLMDFFAGFRHQLESLPQLDGLRFVSNDHIIQSKAMTVR